MYTFPLTLFCLLFWGGEGEGAYLCMPNNKHLYICTDHRQVLGVESLHWCFYSGQLTSCFVLFASRISFGHPLDSFWSELFHAVLVLRATGLKLFLFLEDNHCYQIYLSWIIVIFRQCSYTRYCSHGVGDSVSVLKEIVGCWLSIPATC